TVGVISAKGRNQLHIADFEDFIQTDAAINPGNSGGPLLNIDGQVIGVNTAIVSGSGGYIGIGFAIPSLMANRIIDQLIRDGQVTRGFLGVTLQPIDAELAACYKLEKVYGALVTDVVKGSPADKAGLKQEDVIIAYNGKEVDSLSTFRNAVSLMNPDTRIVLKVVREGKVIEIPVTVSQAPKEDGMSALQRVGIRVQNLTPETAKKLGIAPETKGILIISVEPGSVAASSGIAPGQLILAVNRQKVSSIEDLNRTLKDSNNENILLMVSQGDVIRFIALKPEE
ncbi:HtrA protease/chaperone protein, partial [Chlamydia pneumoniae B21]